MEKNNIFCDIFSYKVIYVFTIDDDAHKGLVKIGDATLHTKLSIDKLSPNSSELNHAALKRIKSYTNTAGIAPKLLHCELAIKNIKNKEGAYELKAFRDHDVHNVLKRSGINNVQIGGSTGTEWYDVDLNTAKQAINAVKNDYANLSNTQNDTEIPIVFRPEQSECIKKVVNHFKKHNRFLINAKMRYGKTFVALEIIKEMAFAKTIIITHRPVVDDGWYDDFQTIFQKDKKYVYGSKNKGYSVGELLDKKLPFVYFASIQDLRGSSEVGGKFKKNITIFDTVWDCVIVDEAHEGTTTALGEDTVKAVVKAPLNKTKFLALSGTPFNIISDYDDDSIYTWDYIQEQESKAKWDVYNFGDSNPYEELPELKIMTYDLSEIVKNHSFVSFDDKAFNFHEFFRTWTSDIEIDHEPMPLFAKVGDFVHEKDVMNFLNLMTKEDNHSLYPFSRNEYRELFRHTLWMVPGVKEARALKKLMTRFKIMIPINIAIVFLLYP